MKIKKFIKKTNGKYELILENNNKIVAYDDFILKNEILLTKEIDDKLLNKLEIENNFYNIYKKVLKYISTRIRSKKEIDEYLEKNNIENDLKERVINELKRQGLIDDEKFTISFINDKLNLSNDGPNKIKNELLKYGISEELVEKQISLIDKKKFIEKINKIIDKKIKTNKKYSDYIFKQKLKNDLSILGFDNENINECINNINLNNDELLEKNFNLIYNKLKNKYENYILKQKIKEKLYQKGFNLSDIERIVYEKLD